jgi:4-hydroxymandelate oxidase
MRPSATLTRRQALGLARQRIAPRDQLVNVLEYEQQAKLTLSPDVFAQIAGSDRAAFDRITIRPRLVVPTTDLDLSVTLFGDTWFAPIAVGPIARQRQFHPDGEVATVKGAAAAQAPIVVSGRSSVPFRDLAAGHAGTMWYQAFASEPAATAAIRDAVDAGCKAVCITVDTKAAINWKAVDVLKRNLTIPVLVKGIATPAEAKVALQHGVQGIVASTYGRDIRAGADELILSVGAIVDAVGGSVPVLVDGSFRRGTDIFKALAFGAKAVLVGRPVMWGLAAYGADGVQWVVEMLQTELARYMAMSGRVNLGTLDRSALQVHAARRDKT